MRKDKLHIFWLVAAAALLLAACNSDARVKVPDDIENALYDRYPDSDISALEWSLTDDGFFVAECRMDGYHCKAWFDASAHWYMTEWGDQVYHDLPQNVREHFESQGLQGREAFRVDFDHVESRYVVEADRAYCFYRMSNGSFIKRVDGTWENRPIVLDEVTLGIVDKKLGTQPVSIVDADMESSPLRLNLYEGTPPDERYRVMYFDTPVAWLATVWRVGLDEVPPAVLDAARALADESRWQAVYRMQHQRVEQAYGFRLDDGTCLYFTGDGLPARLDEVPLPEPPTF